MQKYTVCTRPTNRKVNNWRQILLNQPGRKKMAEDEEFTKNWVWIPDDEEIFIKGYVMDYLTAHKCKVTYKKNNKEIIKEVDQKELQPMNPTKFNKCNDMAELTHLNEPSVIYNLYLRYMDNLIYTYSGLFLVAINPYKSLPIYNINQTSFSQPHIYSIAKITHENLVKNRKDQSILVTGESGAGKTENTKKIIQYLSSINSQSSIDDKILQANPIMESFGNAKTIKNNNSSRFGKFIKIFFDNNNLIGANINFYLLEKSRVIHQQQGERNYHIFYQMLKKYHDLEKFDLENDISKYRYLTVDSDQLEEEDLTSLMESFKIVGFTQDDIDNIFTILAIILHLGNIEFNNLKSEQASFHSKSPIDSILKLLKVKKPVFETNLLSPKVKAGREFVSKSKKPAEVKFLIDSLAKFLYETLFTFIINKINQSLNLKAESLHQQNFIGVLDIAGFEIFKINSFEQLCINFTNEKLQQFFNHHSFILEQSEYLKEDIKWDYIDFGKDLQPTIDLIENVKKPDFGILKILDEECIMPNSNDKQFLDRLLSNFNKNPKFKANKFKSGFIINHYAGEVEYNVDNWLNKNNDPLSDSLLTMLSSSENKFIQNAVKSLVINKKSLSIKYKKQLSDLMDELNNTEPHFVRCILPNLEKKPNKFDKSLVLNQLRCNGVLEGIRITRAGYPNKMVFDDFFRRYSILNAKELYTKNSKTNCELILKQIDLDPETYKIGITKIFFKNGVLGNLEELRDLSIKSIFQSFQSIIRGNLSRKYFQEKITKIQNSQLIARNFIKINEFKGGKTQSDLWYNLFTHLKPLLEDSIKVLNSKEMNENLKEINLKLKDLEKLNKNYEAEHKKLNEKLVELNTKYDENVTLVKEKETIIKSLNKESSSKILTLEKSIKQLETENAALMTEKSRLDDQLDSLQSKYTELNKKYDELNSTHADLDKSHKEIVDSKKVIESELEDEKTNHSKSIDLLKKLKTKIDALKSEKNLLKEQASELESSKNEMSLLKEKLGKLTLERDALEVSSKGLEKSSKELEKAKEKEAVLAEKVKLLTKEKEVLEKKLTKLESDHKDVQSHYELLSNSNKQLESGHSDMKTKFEKLLNEHKSLRVKHDNYTVEQKQVVEKNEQKIKLLTKDLTDKSEFTINKLKARNEELQQQVKNSASEISSIEKKLADSLESAKHLSEVEKNLANKENKIRELNDEVKRISELNGSKIKEYGKKILELNDELTSIKEEKENQPPKQQVEFNQSVMADYSNLKLRLNEVNANLRTEKFENKKLQEEISALRSRLKESPTKASMRRSIAIGENPTSEGNQFLFKQIEDLKIKLEQEELNSVRAENYAIELQKKLNKVQNTRGLNSSMNFESKYRESQLRISELENKFSNLFEKVSPDTTPTKLTKSESFGRSSLINKSLESANQDFVKIYNDITRTLKSTREELTNSKLEILRLKSLLRDSEDELYQIKRDQHKASIENYETELAQLKVKQDNLQLRNNDMIKSLDLYKRRSDEYYKKLELAESSIKISKQHEDIAKRQLEEFKTEFKLIKDELKASEILIKDLNKEKSKVAQDLKDKDFKINTLNDEILKLNDKISYNKKVFENKELTDGYKKEIQDLNNELNFKISNESNLIKENKNLLLDNEILTKEKEEIESDYEVKLEKIQELETKQDELNKKIRVLENDKAINERKLANNTKQITNLKDLINDLSLQRDELLEEKDKLEEANLILNQTLDEKNQNIDSLNVDISILRQHLDNQRLESSEIEKELKSSKTSTSADMATYANLKKDNLVLSQENDAVQKINNDLRSKIKVLENKLYNDEQVKYWENKIIEMNLKLDASNTDNYRLQKIIANHELEIKQLKIKNNGDTKLIKKYNDENFEFKNKLYSLTSNLEILQQEDIDKDMKLKTVERDNLEIKERNLILEREVLQLRSQLGI